MAQRDRIPTRLDASVVADLLDGLTEPAFVVDTSGRVVFWNREAERATGFGRASVLGVRCRDGGLEHVDECGQDVCLQCPLSEAIRSGRAHDTRLWVHHHDGHRVPVSVRVNPLRDASGQIVGAVQVFRDRARASPPAEHLRELERLALLDPLTGIPNRRFIEGAIAARLDETARYGWRVGVMFMDIDRFKDVNDRHGHRVGDRVLQAVARTLVANSRPFDLVGRWGGEEFVSVATHVDARQLRRIAERFRVLVARSTIDPEGDGPSSRRRTSGIGVTISIGAALAHAGDTLDSIVDRADRMMYRCKRLGRNRVSVSAREVLGGGGVGGRGKSPVGTLSFRGGPSIPRGQASRVKATPPR